MQHLSPAEYVVAQFGGVVATARVVCRHHATICKWMLSREAGGCGGYIPGQLHRFILDQARARGLDITPKDLILGHELSEMESA